VQILCLSECVCVGGRQGTQKGHSCVIHLAGAFRAPDDNGEEVRSGADALL
jgi:hypothetical protein